MIKPYYDHGGITIYHGDCLDLIPYVDADVVVTDPPYGHGSLPPRGGARQGTIGSHREDLEWDKDIVDWIGLWDGPCAIFCAAKRCVELVSSMEPDGMLVYVKSNPSPIGSSFEPCFTRGFKGTARHMTAYNSAGGKLHPTQKPLDLMAWIVSLAPRGTVLDPFAGSGTTLRASKDLGRKAIGIEMSEKYCEIAAKRMSQEVLFSGAVQ